MNRDKTIKWEYCKDYNISESTLNKFGADGWELVAVTTTYENETLYEGFYFKRLL